MAKVTLRPIVPKQPVVRTEAVLKAIAKEQKAVASELRRDFQETTSGWKHRVRFAVSISEDVITVYTDDNIYNFVSSGTKPHWIYPRRGRALKFDTHEPAGFAAYAFHPGTRAKNFAQKIAARWRGVYPARMQAAIDEATGG